MSQQFLDLMALVMGLAEIAPVVDPLAYVEDQSAGLS